MTSIKRRNTLKFLCAAAALPLVSGCDDALQADTDTPQALQTPDALGDSLREDVERRMKKAGVTGLSIALVDDQQLPWYFASGWADKENNIPARPQTQYRAGSVSKLFTVTAALQLAAQGKLDLDAPIQAVLPEFQIRSRFGAAPITARLLMTHRAGLPRDVLGGMFMDQPEAFDAMVRRLRDAELICPPGLLMSYSNVGLTVLGAAVQRLAGAPFEEHLRRSLLKPLGMTQAGFAVHPADGAAMAAAYDEQGRAREPGLRDMPAGGLNASVLDLSRFLSMIFAEGRAGDAQVLPAAWVREMLRPQFAGGADALPSRPTGLGWMVDEAHELSPQAGPLVHHAGATLYHRAAVMALPRHRLGVAVAANDSRATKLLSEVARQALRWALEARTGLRPSRPTPSAPALAEAPLPAEELAAYAGRYTTEVGLVQLRPDGSRLQAQALGERFQLRADAQGWLHPRYALLGLIPWSVPDLDKLAVRRRRIAERDVLVLRTEGQELLLGERLAPPAADAPRWRDVAGRYVPVLQAGEAALVEHVDVSEEDGLLLARVKLPARYGGLQPAALVHPVSESEARTPGPLAGMGDMVRRCEVDGRPGFEVAGLRFRKAQA